MENQSTPPAPKSNAGQGMGIAALVLGIITIPFAMFPCTATFSLIPALLAIVFGVVGLNQAKKGNAGQGLPIAGLVIGVLCAIFSAFWTYELVMGAKQMVNEIKSDTTLMQGLDSLTQKLDSLQKAQDSLKNK